MFLSDTNFQNMDTVYKVPLHLYQKSGIKVIIEPPTMISITKLALLKLEPQHSSKYKTILENCSFNILQLLKDCAKEEKKAPKTLPHVEEGIILRSTRSNNMCMHHFVGLCVWKHMNDGKYWMTKNDLDPMKILNNIEQFKGYVYYLRENENVLWRHLLVSGEFSIDTHKVYSFCANIRNKYRNSVWDLNLSSMVGVFRLFYDLLEQIQFPFRD